MSTENNETAPLPVTPGDRPTTPIPRAGRARGDDPTQIFETFGGDRTDEPGGETAAQPTAATAAQPTAGTPVQPNAATAGDAPGTGRSGVATAVPLAAPSATGDRPTGTEPPSEPDAAAGRRTRPPLRVATVVWGLVVAVIGAGIIAVAAGAVIDVELALIGLLALAGAALVAGSVAAEVRRRR